MMTDVDSDKTPSASQANGERLNNNDDDAGAVSVCDRTPEGGCENNHKNPARRRVPVGRITTTVRGHIARRLAGHSTIAGSPSGSPSGSDSGHAVVPGSEADVLVQIAPGNSVSAALAQALPAAGDDPNHGRGDCDAVLREQHRAANAEARFQQLLKDTIDVWTRVERVAAPEAGLYLEIAYKLQWTKTIHSTAPSAQFAHSKKGRPSI